jgi:hypothetical protein
MQWFIVVYAATGLSVAVSPPQKYSFVPHNKEWCELLRDNREQYYKEYRPEKDYAFVCEQHKEQPRRTGKLDRELQSRLNWVCPEPSMACEMQEYDIKHHLPLGTTSRRYWKARGG